MQADLRLGGAPTRGSGSWRITPDNPDQSYNLPLSALDTNNLGQVQQSNNTSTDLVTRPALDNGLTTFFAEISKYSRSKVLIKINNKR